MPAQDCSGPQNFLVLRYVSLLTLSRSLLCRRGLGCLVRDARQTIGSFGSGVVPSK